MNMNEFLGRLSGYLILAIASLVLCFGGIAIIMWDINPGTWVIEARGVAVVLAVCLFFLAAGMKNANAKE